ncbi:phosphoenolpyruvate carboxylase gene, partial [Tanacetum coccineum]
IRDCLAQLYAKDITPDDKQELNETLHREIQDLMFEISMWRCTDELHLRAEELYRSARSNVKHYIVGIGDLRVIEKALIDHFVHGGSGIHHYIPETRGKIYGSSTTEVIE